MREPKTEYCENLSAASQAYLIERLADARDMAQRIRHRQTRNEWLDEQMRVQAEIDRRAGPSAGTSHGA